MYGEEKKTSTVLTAKNMDTPLKNVTGSLSMDKNSHNVTKTVTKKSSSGRSKNMVKIKKRKRLMSLKRYITTRFFLAMMHLRAK